MDEVERAYRKALADAVWDQDNERALDLQRGLRDYWENWKVSEE